jgi:hypothetical protein
MTKLLQHIIFMPEGAVMPQGKELKGERRRIVNEI